MTKREQIMSVIESKDKEQTKNDPNKIGLLEALRKINQYEEDNGINLICGAMQFNTLAAYYHARAYNATTERRIAKGLGLCG
jgi:hypothetical protein